MNMEIAEFLDYKKYIGSKNKVRKMIVDSIGIEVCPYCNRNFIDSFNLNRKSYVTCDIDHFYPKSIFPLFALSLYNYVPSCKICNQSFKSDVVDNEIIYPYYEEYGDDGLFSLNINFNKKRDDFEYEVKVLSNNKKIINSKKIFKIEEIYNNHKFLINDIVNKSKYFTDDYIKKIIEDYLNLGINISFEELKAAIYCYPLDKREELNMPLSKFRKEVSMQLTKK